MGKAEYLSEAGRLADRDGLDFETALMRVLLAQLATMPVPTAIVPTLKAAEEHWFGRTGDLSAAKVAVWTYIESIASSGRDLALPEGRVARALLCVLDSAPDTEAIDMTVESFVAMTDEAGR
jgi:hypothetical protein